MKKFFAILLAVSMLMLASCAKNGEPTENGFIDPNTGIEYVDVTPLGLYAVSKGEEYITVGEGGNETVYYEVEFEDPNRFLCYEDSGELLVVRAKDVDEPNVKSFDPIAAFIYNQDNDVYITTFYADAEYLPEEDKYANPSEDTDLCQLIASAISEGEAANVPAQNILTEDMFFIRLLSEDYPGLYYLVVFYGATDGRYYLFDRAAEKTVYCPYDIIIRMVGGYGSDSDSSAA